MKAPIATVNTKAILHNVKQIKHLAPNSKVLAIVKANAYGLGLINIYQSLANVVDGFGVARIVEALSIQESGFNGKIILLEGCFDKLELGQALSRQFDVVIHNEKQLEDLEELTKSWQERLDEFSFFKPLNIYFPIMVWLKIDTGMHRLGIEANRITEFVQRLQNCALVKEIGFMSHLSCADEENSIYVQNQIANFQELTANYQGAKTIAASGGILFYENSHYDWIRPGISLYGISPGSKNLSNFGFQQAVTLKSQLIAIRLHKAGEPVGYSRTWIAKQNTKIGVVAIGYGDGYPRNAPSGTPVLVNGRIVPLVGRVSMDMLTVDLGIECTDKIGDPVILWGENLPIEEIANKAGTIGYELLTRLTQRVEFEYL